MLTVGSRKPKAVLIVKSHFAPYSDAATRKKTLD
jgi:hypothetical protein